MLHVLMLFLALGDDHCEQHKKTTETKQTGHTQHQHHAAVDQRGDQPEGMGFSHQKTRHTFRLLKDGGAIEVRAKDDESLKAVRSHLQEIARLFTAGDFEKPQFIHGRVPDGVDVMKARGTAITYKYEEVERGGRVRITTKDPAALEAVHRFLRFQIEDHRTGDKTAVE
ncbi:MAG TPA: hypothetical protein VF618_07550 [Thermoanaerobaculia bacterium]